MAMWPFNRRKRKGSRSAEAEAEAPNLGISTRITAQDPKQVRREQRSNSKPQSRQPSRPRGQDISLAAHGIEKLRDQSSTPDPAPNGVQTAVENGRKPLTEVRNPVADLSKPSPLKSLEKNFSQDSLQRERSETQPITPTLQNKRSRGAMDGQRQKSIKRRTEDKDRLQEIKTMSAPIPVPKRPRSVTQSSTPLAQDSRRVRSGLNRNLERPLSEVSLPLADSLRSSFSGNLELSSSYRVSPFDALSPRPTIRYADGSRQVSDLATPSRTSTKKEKGPAIPEEDFSPRARIKDLADDMDAAALRELMERDRRRRERKKRSDKDKLERRLQRKAEKQKEKAQREKEAADTAPGDDSGDVQMRDAEGAGPSQRRSPTLEPAVPPDSGPQVDFSPESLVPEKPTETADIAEREEEKPYRAEETQEEVVRPATPPRRSVPAETPASESRANLAVLTPVTTPQHAAAASAGLAEAKESPSSKFRDPRRDSEGPSRWKSIFRRSGTKHRGSSDRSRGTPSEFSNTSRESFARQQKEKAVAAAAAVTPLHLPPAIPREPKGRSASNNTPHRTKSKFREDLPEFISPPMSQHSRVNSRDSPVSPVSPRIQSMVEEDEPIKGFGDVDPTKREAQGLVRNLSQRSGTPDGQSAALLSQSLASVDSEGSWLSGRPQKRSSIPISKREGGDSISEQLRESAGEAHVQDANYFARRDPTSGLARGHQPSGIAAQLARGLQGTDDAESAATSTQHSPVEDPQPKGGRVAGRQPVVMSSEEAHRSRQGLVEMYLASGEVSPREDAEPNLERPGTADDDDTGSLHEATSVDYNKGHHSRRVSAGSARILEIPGRDREKRNSGLSVGGMSGASSQYSPAIPQRTDEENHAVDDDKRQSTISVESSGDTGRTAGLGLGLRLGRRIISGQGAVPDAEN